MNKKMLNKIIISSLLIARAGLAMDSYDDGDWLVIGADSEIVTSKKDPVSQSTNFSSSSSSSSSSTTASVLDLNLTDAEYADKKESFQAQWQISNYRGRLKEKVYYLGFMAFQRLFPNPHSHEYRVLTYRPKGKEIFAYGYDGSSPKYLKSSFKVAKQTKVFGKPGFYTYDQEPFLKNGKVFHVNFANRSLGGGFKTDDSAAQEECIFMEHPELVDYALRTGAHTRTTTDKVKGSPTPIIFMDIKRIAHFNLYKKAPKGPIDSDGRLMIGGKSYTIEEGYLIDNKGKLISLYGSGFQKNLSVDEISLQFEVRDVPQNTNIISIAAVRHYVGGHQYDQAVIEDLLNTAISGFNLPVLQGLRENFSVDVATGKFGAGVFGNDAILVNVIQQFAAMITGVESITFYDYENSQQNKASTIVQNILATPPKSIEELIGKIRTAFVQ